MQKRHGLAAIHIEPERRWFDKIHSKRTGKYKYDKDNSGKWFVWLDPEKAANDRKSREALKPPKPEMEVSMEPSIGSSINGLELRIQLLNSELAAKREECDALRTRVDERTETAQRLEVAVATLTARNDASGAEVEQLRRRDRTPLRFARRRNFYPMSRSRSRSRLCERHRNCNKGNEHDPRVDNPFKIAPDAVKAMMALDTTLHSSGLENNLLGLVKLRASQINGCAFCIHMHVNDLRRHGETEMRLYMLTTWRESSLYTDRERALLAWTEALTRIAETGAPDADYKLFKTQFSEVEQVNLTFAIGTINVWNRLQIGFRAPHPVDAPRVAA